MFPLKVFTLVCLLGLPGAISAASSNRPDPMAVRAALEHLGRAPASSPDAKARAAATKTSALLQFSLTGSGTQDPIATDGTCSGGACSASGGDCQCLTLQGTLSATQVGDANFTAGITVNIDDCVNTGTPGPDGLGSPAFCCFSDGVLDATTTGKSPSILELSFTGLVCTDPGANDDISSQAGFIVVTANSSGKFQHTAGTGQLNLFVADDFTAYLAGSGVIQVTSPF